MARSQVVGVYGSVARARVVQEALITEGTPEDQVSISVDLTADGIAAEAPGQAYVNQPGDGGSAVRWQGADGGPRAEPQLAATRAGGCVVTAAARNAHEARRIRAIMAALRPLDLRATAE